MDGPDGGRHPSSDGLACRQGDETRRGRDPAPSDARSACRPRQGERDVLACVARGHSNKYTAYLLGLATSTVSTRLESALRKLGLTSRREAIETRGEN